MAFTSSYTPGLIQQSEYFYGTPLIQPNLSGSFSGSFAGDGTNLNLASNSTIPASDPFPFTGDAQISGSLKISGSIEIDSFGDNNVIIGSGSGEVLSSGTHNIIFGNNAATSLTTGGSNLIIGHRAGKSTALNQESGNTLIGIGAGEDGTFLANYGDNTFIGYNAGKNSAAQFSTFVGSGVGQGTTSFSVAMGANGTLSCTATAAVALGYNSQTNGTNNYNVSIGTSAMRSSNGGSINEYNIAIGYQAQFTSYRNYNNIVIGAKAAYGASYIKEDIFIGHEAGYDYSGTNNVSGRNTVIGYRAGYDLGDTSAHNILIGQGVGAENVVLNNQLKIGSGSLITISGSLETGDVIFHNTASAPSFSGSFQGDGSQLTNLPSSFTAAGISGSFTEASGGFSTRVTTLETSPAAGFPFAGDAVITGSLLISASNNTSSSLVVQGSGSTIFEVQGSQGQLFSITDDLIHSVLEVSDISGDTLFKVSGSGLITIPVGDLTGSAGATASYGAFKGDGSQLTNLPQNSPFTAAGISGSLGDNAALIRSLTAVGISGSFVEASASLSSRITDNATNLKAITSSLTTAGRMVFVGAGGTLTSEEGFTYNATTNQLAVENLIVTHLTSSFVTASRVTTSGSNIFGDSTSDTQTLIGTTLMSGSAQISGSLKFGGNVSELLYTGGKPAVIDTSAVGGIKAKGAILLNASADSTYNSRILFGTSHAAMSFGRLQDSSAAIRGVTQNYAWQLFGIRHGYNNPGSGFHYTTDLPDTTFADNLTISGSGTYMSEPLKVHGSGSKVFEVIGTEGTLFSIDDDLDGTLFNVKDKTGIPIFEISASSDVFIGDSPTSLYRTAQIVSTTANVTQSIHSLSTSSYDGAFIEYTAISASNARAGNIMTIWDGSNVTFTETTTTDIGDTSDLLFQVALTQSVAQIQSYTTSTGYRLKTIIKAI